MSHVIIIVTANWKWCESNDEVLSQYFPVRPRKDTKTCVRIVGAPAEIRIRELPETTMRSITAFVGLLCGILWSAEEFHNDAEYSSLSKQ
jgi:hypothetical protein